MNLATCQKQSQVTVGISYNIKTLLLYDRLKKTMSDSLKNEHLSIPIQYILYSNEITYDQHYLCSTDKIY